MKREAKTPTINEGWLVPLLRAWQQNFGPTFVSVAHVLAKAASQKKPGVPESPLRAALKNLPGAGKFSKLKFARLVGRIDPIAVSGFRFEKHYDAHRKAWSYAVLKTSAPAPKVPKVPKPAKEPAHVVATVAAKHQRAPAAVLDESEAAIARETARADAFRRDVPAQYVPEPVAVAPELPRDSFPSDVWAGPFGTADEADSARARIARHGACTAVTVEIGGRWFAHSIGVEDPRRIADALRRIYLDLRRTARVGLHGSAPSREALVSAAVSDAREWSETRRLANPVQVFGRRS